MRSLLVALLSALAVNAQPSTTTNVLQVIRQGSTGWSVKNVGSQAVTAYVFHTGGGEMHAVFPNELNTGPMILSNAPIAPGAISEVLVNPTDQLEIPAVILADGTVLGSAVTKEGFDIVKYIFDLWQGEAREMRYWATVAKQRPAELKKELNSARDPDPAQDKTRGANYSAVVGIRNEIKRLLDNEVANGMVTDTAAELSQRAQRAEVRTTRKAGVK